MSHQNVNSVLSEGLDDDPWGNNVTLDFSEPDYSGGDYAEESIDSSDDESLTSSRRAYLEHLDALSDASGRLSPEGDFSDGESIIIRTGDEVPPIPTATMLEHRSPCVYAPETLMSLIPATPDFDKVRETLRITKTIYRFSKTQSNTVWAREYAKRFKEPPSKSLKIYKIVFQGDQLRRFYGNKHPYARERLFRPLRRKPINRRPVKPVKVQRSGLPEVVTPLNPEAKIFRSQGKLAQISRIKIDNDQVLVNEIGGISYSLRNLRRVNATKWYRERKGQPFFYNSFGVIRALRKDLGQNDPLLGKSRKPP